MLYLELHAVTDGLIDNVYKDPFDRFAIVTPTEGRVIMKIDEIQKLLIGSLGNCGSPHQPLEKTSSLHGDLPPKHDSNRTCRLMCNIGVENSPVEWVRGAHDH